MFAMIAQHSLKFSAKSMYEDVQVLFCELWRIRAGMLLLQLHGRLLFLLEHDDTRP